MVRNSQVFNKAVQLRKQGKSYLEIHTILHVPKSTLSCWFAKKIWSDRIQKQLISNNKKSSALRLKQLNKLKTIYKLQRYEAYKKEARQEYALLKNDPLFLIGISLYWGEGEKAEKGRVSVINSDVGMIQIVVAFYRKTLHIPENKLRAALFLYPDHNEHSMRAHWSEVTGIPEAQFIKSQVLPSRSILTKRKTEYGMCTVYFSDTKINIKIKEWIHLLADDMRV